MSHDPTLPAGFACFRIISGQVQVPPCYATAAILTECAATAVCLAEVPGFFAPGWYYRTDADNFPSGPHGCMGDAVKTARVAMLPPFPGLDVYAALMIHAAVRKASL